MRAGMWRIVLAVVVSFASSLAVPARGQAPPPAAKPPVEPAAAAPDAARPADSAKPADSPKPVAGPEVEARELHTFLLRDSKGNLVPVLGMTFDEFEQLLKFKKGLAPPPPPGFTLDALSIAGTVNGSVCDLQITLTIRIRDEGWVRVPLGLAGVVIRQPPKHEGSGEHFLSYEEADGHVAWLQGAGDKPHIVSIQATAGLTKLGEDTRLAISLPRATEASLRMTVPGGSLEANLAGGEGIVTTASKDGARSEITVLGASGDLSLAWRPAREAMMAGPPLFDASGEIAVKVESESRISSDAKLRIRSLSKPLDVFQVRLPPGMELVPTSPTGYSVSIVSPPAVSGGGRGAQPQVVEVRLDKPATGAIEVRLLATSLPAAVASPTLSPARFEVVGAVRQRGTIDVTVEGEWQLDWQEDASVRRLDISADASAARLAARYEYFRQPCGLALKVSARPSRVTVEPTHIVHVEPRQIRVETTLKYRLRGSRAAGLAFHLGSLQFDRLAADDLLDAPDPPGTDGTLHIPFRPGSALPGDVELKLETHQALPEGADQFTLTLPRPLADSVAPATVYILAADNVELSPKTAELAGLSPDPAIARPGMGARQQPPLVYRDLGGGDAAVFAAGLRTRTRSTVASAHADVQIDRRQMQIVQRLDYRISHEPQRTFVLVAPRGLSDVGGLQVWLGSEPLTLSPAPAVAAGTAVSERVQFSTPVDQIGAFSVEVRYTQPLPRWDGLKPLGVNVPLVLPADEAQYQFSGQQIEFHLGDDLQIEPELTGVDEFSHPTASPGAPPGTAYHISKASGLTRWTLQPAHGTQATSITCHKTWVQTWLTPLSREERASFRLTTTAEAVAIKLPEGTAPASVQAAVNAQPVAIARREAGRYRVELPAATRSRECVLEVWYSLPPPTRRAGLIVGSLEPAQLDAATPPRRMYWQLALPEGEHLLLPPADLAPEMAWSNVSWLLGRSPLLDQRQLEEWIESSRQDPLPRGMNEYLFGALGRAPTMSLVVANRRLLLILVSGVVLALGLAVMHSPRLRSPGLLLVAAGVVAGLAIAAPDAALLIGWAAILGLAIGLVVAILQWAVTGRPAMPAATSIAPPNESVASTTPRSRSPRPAPLTTATAPAPLAVGDSRR